MANIKSRQEYMRRIHIVQDYIEAHIEEALPIHRLAEVAGFSKYHFDRIFKGLLEESLSQYVTRLKLTRAAQLLIYRPDMSVTAIAYRYGFTDSAVFCRAFKSCFSLSPSAYRAQNRKNRKDPLKISVYNEYKPNHQMHKALSCEPVSVEIITAAQTPVAYVRHIGSYDRLAKDYPQLVSQLMRYISAHPTISLEENSGYQSLVLAIYHDNPEFTRPEQLRTSLCVTLPPQSGNCVYDEAADMGLMSLPGGKYVVGHFEIDQLQYGDAWDYMYGQWLTNSDFLPRDSDPFEVYRNLPKTHPQHKHLVDIYLPIEPLLI